ncbi:MAG TPA: response regulator [Steroidobacteraceae bacterium]|nr:response regulator [Steroidobacteraceae bacterium]
MTDAMFRILVVEDDADIRRVLRALLEAEGYRVVEADSAARALVESRSHQPDVVLVDLGLPDRDGQALIRDVRRFSSVPILVLSARTLETEKIQALDGGADDYVTKPFNSGELLARVRAALRRNARSPERSPSLRIGSIAIDLATREARGSNGDAVHFTPLEYRLLVCLARAHGLVVTRDQLIGEVWGPDRMDDTRGLRAYVKGLRQKLEPDPARPRYLLTEPGLGYRLVAEQDEPAPAAG